MVAQIQEEPALDISDGLACARQAYRAQHRKEEAQRRENERQAAEAEALKAITIAQDHSKQLSFLLGSEITVEPGQQKIQFGDVHFELGIGYWEGRHRGWVALMKPCAKCDLIMAGRAIQSIAQLGYELDAPYTHTDDCRAFAIAEGEIAPDQLPEPSEEAMAAGLAQARDAWMQESERRRTNAIAALEKEVFVQLGIRLVATWDADEQKAYAAVRGDVVANEGHIYLSSYGSLRAYVVQCGANECYHAVENFIVRNLADVGRIIAGGVRCDECLGVKKPGEDLLVALAEFVEGRVREA